MRACVYYAFYCGILDPSCEKISFADPRKINVTPSTSWCLSSSSFLRHPTLSFSLSAKSSHETCDLGATTNRARPRRYYLTIIPFTRTVLKPVPIILTNRLADPTSRFNGLTMTDLMHQRFSHRCNSRQRSRLWKQSMPTFFILCIPSIRLTLCDIHPLLEVEEALRHAHIGKP